MSEEPRKPLDVVTRPSTDADCECRDYYEERASEITNWIKRQLESMTVRDESFVDVLKAKIARKVSWEEVMERQVTAAGDVLSDVRSELKEDVLRRARTRVADVKQQLSACSEEVAAEIRSGDRNHYEDDELAAMAMENRKLKQRLDATAATLSKLADEVTALRARVTQGEYKNQQLKCTATAAIRSAAKEFSSA